MGTLSQTRALFISCLLTGLIVYTLSSRFQTPPLTTVAPVGRPGGMYVSDLAYGEDEVAIPHGISVFKPDNYKKHLVLPRMSNEDVSWLTYLPAEMNIAPKTYLVDADLSNPPAGALTTPVNKVGKRVFLVDSRFFLVVLTGWLAGCDRDMKRWCT